MKSKIVRIVTNTILVSSLFTLACAFLKMEPDNVLLLYFIKCVAFSIYFGLIVYWGLAVMKRIMNTKIRHYMIASAFSMLVWIIVYAIRRYVFAGADYAVYARFCGYIYYICELVIAYCAFMVSECIIEKNEKQVKLDTICTAIPNVFLGVLALTNEMHGLFIEVDRVNNSITYSYGYFTTVAWISGIALFTLFRLPKKETASKYNIQVIAPFLIATACAVYCGVHFYREGNGMPIYVELAAGFSLFTIAFWESLINTGLIPSNNDYGWCFNHSAVRAQILDRNGRSVYQSIESRSLGEDEVATLLKDGYYLRDVNTEMVSVPIKGGYVAWERDIKDANLSIKRLSETRESVREAADTLERNIELEKRRKVIADRNHLYDITFTQVSDKLDMLSNLINKARELKGELQRKALRSIDIYGVYVKRKSNLILLSEQTVNDFTGELRLCFKETFDNLNDAGVNGSFTFVNVSAVDYSTADFLYGAFESVLEVSLIDVESVSMILAKIENAYTLTVNVMTMEPKDYSAVCSKYQGISGVFVESEESDTEETISFYVRKEGLS